MITDLQCCTKPTINLFVHFVQDVMTTEHDVILNPQSIYASNGINTVLPGHFLSQLETAHLDLRGFAEKPSASPRVFKITW